MTTLQTLTSPHGWTDSPPDYRGPDYCSWETTGGLRAIVTARAMDGNRRGWYRVRCGTIQGGRGAGIEVRVRAEGLQRRWR